jgi:uncharacterized RDD family membrane protein YckC
MGKRAIAATSAALVTLFLAVVPALADQEYALTPPTIDWRLVVILTAVALGVFYYVLEVMNRGRKDGQ